MGATYSVIGPVRFDTNASQRPSGETAGENSPAASFVTTTGLPPPADTIAMSFDPISSVPYTSDAASGVQTGRMRYSDSS
jgi:hypothetical protein